MVGIKSCVALLLASPAFFPSHFAIHSAAPNTTPRVLPVTAIAQGHAMRLSFILVAAATMLLSSCDAATQSEQTQLSTSAAAPVSSSRFLRSAEAVEEDKENKEEDSEERMMSLKNIKVPSYLNHPLLAPEKQVLAAVKAAEKATKLSKTDDAILTKPKSVHNGLDRFKRWKTQGFTPAEVKKILTQANAKKGGPEWQTYYQYMAAYLRQNHKVT